MVERVARIVGLDICGIDIIAPTLEPPVKENGGTVIEVNAAPGPAHAPVAGVGTPRNVAAPIVDMLFPAGARTTSARRRHRHQRQDHDRAAHRPHHGAAGYSVGMTTTDGIYVRGQLIVEGT